MRVVSVEGIQGRGKMVRSVSLSATLSSAILCSSCGRARPAKLMVLHPVVHPRDRPIAAIGGVPITPATDPTSNIGGPLAVVDEERAVDAQRQYRTEVEEGFLERVACRIGIARSELCE